MAKKTKEVKIERRNLTQTEVKEIVRMTELINAELWKQDLLSKNTAMVTNGKELLTQIMEVNKLLLSAKQAFVSQILVNCGIPVGQAVSFNIETGIIEETEQPKVDKKPKK